jgi:hypothetical protein
VSQILVISVVSIPPSATTTGSSRNASLGIVEMIDQAVLVVYLVE